MPETQDWAAAPQTGVQALSTVITAVETGTTQHLNLGVAGQQLVLVQLALNADPAGSTFYPMNDAVGVDVYDDTPGLQLTTLVVSPGAPFALFTPPFGALRLTAGSDVMLVATTTYGAGACIVGMTVFYYYQKA